jgi:phage tail sheath gpL-like
MLAGSASGANYVPVPIVNIASLPAASGEVQGYFGNGSELAKMVIAAIAANTGTGNYVNIIAIPLASTDTAWGSSGEALTALDKLGCEYVASCYDAQTSMSNNTALINEVSTMSQANRTTNGQFGSIAVAVNQSVTLPSTLNPYNSAYLSPQWFRNSAPTQLVGEIAAAVAAQLNGLQTPFNPVNGLVLPYTNGPAMPSDAISIGFGLESETALKLGWAPLKVLKNGQVAQVRSVTSLILESDDVTPVVDYFDCQDLMVLYFWRQTLAARYAQPDFAQAKASGTEAALLLSEVVRLAGVFQDNGMFQGVDNSARNFVVQRNQSDRTRFDVLTPVDVVPILAVIATNVQAGTFADALTL